MISIHTLTFNPFAENTYIIVDETTKVCAIVDPGCMSPEEEQELLNTIEDLQVTPIRCLNTHCHIDHILGNWFVFSTFNLKPEIHALELPVLEAGDQVAKMYGIPYRKSPDPVEFLDVTKPIEIGNLRLEMLFTPGHSPGSVSFHCKEAGWVVGGDVLFQNSIGRTDLPGGNHDTLIRSIEEKLFVLDDQLIVYPGHGPATTIGHERLHNPFLT
jgi:glyoxylase-like metal-dependent hydrolase (beta-lactamase superfamily II)